MSYAAGGATLGPVALLWLAQAMLIYSMSVSVDGFIADRDSDFGWTAPTDEQFRFSLAQVGELGAYLLGRRLYETMLVWETDPSLCSDEALTGLRPPARAGRGQDLQPADDLRVLQERHHARPRKLRRGVGRLTHRPLE